MTIKEAKIYPQDALQDNPEADPIRPGEANTLDELFRERVRRNPDKVAYSQYDNEKEHWYGLTWAQIASQVERWQIAIKDLGMKKGDRVAICYKNSIEWVIFDQAALRLGLVVVPLYTADRADNMAYVLANSEARIAIFEDLSRWQEVLKSDEDLSNISKVLIFNNAHSDDSRVQAVDDWLPQLGQKLERGINQADDLASIVYTSGTTGRPKGVMLSHKNMLSNAYAGMRSIAVLPSDRLLSFLPLSHTLERTVGYYGSILSGASVTFNRSIPQLSDDLQAVQPTVLISVPRIFERVHNRIYSGLEKLNLVKRLLFRRAIKTGWHAFEREQGRAAWHPRLLLRGLLDNLVAAPIRERLGGQLKFAVVGGAPLSIEVAKTFTSLGIPLLQGYGLTESSPIVSVNTLAENKPDSIGLPLRGVEVKLIDNDELCIKGENVMLGYWNRPKATAKTMHGDWLKSGDRAVIDQQGFIRIIGRIKDILVLANGEKVPPPDIEAAISRDPLFEQVLVVGEGRAYLSVIVVLNPELWQANCQNNKLDPSAPNAGQASKWLLQKVAAQMGDFPGYARIRAIHASLDEWTIESGMITPTLKIKRPVITKHYQSEIDRMYEGHGVVKS